MQLQKSSFLARFINFTHNLIYIYRWYTPFTSKKTFEEKLDIFFVHIRAKYNGDPTEEHNGSAASLNNAQITPVDKFRLRSIEIESYIQ